MKETEQLHQCINDCQKVVKDLQSLASDASDKRLKSTLDESAHHLEMCIHECEFASKQAP